MAQHEWEQTISVDAFIGFHKPARAIKIFAPDPLSIAITGQVSCLSFEHGPGRRIQLGPNWLRRAHEAADDIERQVDEID